VQRVVAAADVVVFDSSQRRRLPVDRVAQAQVQKPARLFRNVFFVFDVDDADHVVVDRSTAAVADKVSGVGVGDGKHGGVSLPSFGGHVECLADAIR